MTPKKNTELFIQKMKILGTPCGETDPFLPELGWDSNPTRMELGDDDKELNLPMYYGSIVGNCVLGIGITLLILILVVGYDHWKENSSSNLQIHQTQLSHHDSAANRLFSFPRYNPSI